MVKGEDRVAMTDGISMKKKSMVDRRTLEGYEGDEKRSVRVASKKEAPLVDLRREEAAID